MMHLLINSFYYTIRNNAAQYFLHQNSNIILDTQSYFFASIIMCMMHHQ